MDKDKIFQAKTDVTHGRGYVYLLQYHIVWCTKFQKAVFTDGLEQIAAGYLRKTAKTLEMDILAMEVMPDHIHLLVSAKPQMRPSDAVKILKGNTARWLFMHYPKIQKELHGGHLWNPSYFVVSLSDRSMDQIRDYLDHQK